MNIKGTLLAAIDDYGKGGLQNDEFLKKAHDIYNTYVENPQSLLETEHPYLLGIVFAAFAKFYTKEIDYYTSIIENALFCFLKVLKSDDSGSECQCAAIRMLLLIDDNYWIMQNIMSRFIEERCQELYKYSLLEYRISVGTLEPWTYERDILRQIGHYCIEKSSSEDKDVFLSCMEMRRFYAILLSNRYDGGYFLTRLVTERVFMLFSEFVKSCIVKPIDRRRTILYLFEK